MINFKYKKTTISLPSGWHDLNCVQMQLISKTTDFKEAFKIVTSFEVEQVSKKIIPYFMWLSESVELDNIDVMDGIYFDNEFYKVPDITECTWGQKILSHNLVKEISNSNVFFLVPEIAATYLQPLITKQKHSLDLVEEVKQRFLKCSFFEMYGIAKNLIEQLKVVVENENKAFQSPPNLLAEQAGAANLRQFGDFNDIDLLAGGDVLKHELVLQLEYNLIFQKLRYNKIYRKFETELERLKKPQNGH